MSQQLATSPFLKDLSVVNYRYSTHEEREKYLTRVQIIKRLQENTISESIRPPRLIRQYTEYPRQVYTIIDRTFVPIPIENDHIMANTPHEWIACKQNNEIVWFVPL
jgi:hypothetical protein